ncbi:hypothetical protein D7D52_17440 [Nocardia yunnanensis]|uniref:Uncharacterized protein n=1 Tax=Nocardia yunnanensis TaxID=2382165 RepID=A0A386ZFF0_9NOCA|nr:hypothetical protein [Nocardia yunnanensis]AYF75355.1 hypothetical protein D7D52_17440 [Nocardia yunnanensis]
MREIDPEQARAALDAAGRARRQVAEEVGLPRGYWWAMGCGWVFLGVIGQFAPGWVVAVATLAFGAGHATVASRWLDGRRRTGQVRVSAQVAGRRTPLVVIGMLLGLVALTVAAAVVLEADGAAHAPLWSAVLVAAIIGFGGPEMLRVGRRWVRA